MNFIYEIKNKINQIPLRVKVSIILLLCGILQKGISVLTTPIFTRLLSTSEYGQFNLYSSWSSLLIIFITLNLSSGVYTQGYIKYEKSRDKFTSSLIGLTFFIVCITYVIYLTNVTFWNNLFNLTTVTVNCMFLSMLFSSIFGFWEAQQRVNLNYKMYVFVTLLISILKPTLGIISIILFPTHKVEARIVSMTIVEVVIYIFPMLSLLKKSKSLFNSFFWKYALKFNIPLIPHYLSQSILSQSDRIMISKLCTVSDVGIYSLSYTLSTLMIIVNNAVMNIFSPWIYTCIKEKKLNKIGKNSYYLLVIIAIFNLFVIIVAPEVISIFAPPSYKESIWVIPPVTMSVFFMFMYSMFANFSFYYEKTTLIMFASVLAAISNILLNAIFIPIFGYIAAAYTTLICYILFDLFHYLLMRNICKKYLDNIKVYDVKIIIMISISFMVIGFIFMCLFNYILIRYLILVFLLLVIYFNRKKLILLINHLKK